MRGCIDLMELFVYLPALGATLNGFLAVFGRQRRGKLEDFDEGLAAAIEAVFGRSGETRGVPPRLGRRGFGAGEILDELFLDALLFPEDFFLILPIPPL